MESWLLSANKHAIDPKSILLNEYDGIQFIDCGNNLKSIKCPKCGKQINVGIWKELMEKDYDILRGHKMVEVYQCSCELTSKLYALNYKSPCGFSTSWLSVVVVSHFWTGWLLNFPWIGYVEAIY